MNNVFHYLRNEINGVGNAGRIKLKGYEKYMIAHGKSPATVGIYLRTLKVIHNKAISDGIAFKELYPFSKGKYVIPQSRNFKKAIDRDDLTKIQT